jgi:hypothetical protein
MRFFARIAHGNPMAGDRDGVIEWLETLHRRLTLVREVWVALLPPGKFLVWAMTAAIADRVFGVAPLSTAQRAIELLS